MVTVMAAVVGWWAADVAVGGVGGGTGRRYGDGYGDGYRRSW